jgi:hypothetical protein
MSRISMPVVGKAAGPAINKQASGHRLKYLLIGALGILALAGCGNAPGDPPGAYGREPQYSPWLSYDADAANHPHLGAGTHGGGARSGGGHAGGGRGGHGGGHGR